MKLYAQIGYGLGNKLNDALDEHLLDGGIFSPKDLQKETLQAKVTEVRSAFPDADILVDPQFYASLLADSPNANPGHLADEGAWSYFRNYRLGRLEVVQTVRTVLDACLRQMAELDVTGLIAPTVYISQSLDSREAVIAKSFLREARDVYAQLNDARPLYASLVICREALQDRREFEEFVNDITMVERQPDGIYLVVAGRSSEARSDIFHTDVIANWMLLNLALSVNGLQVINGYSDILTPFLGVAGGTAGATGWYSNLRTFSMDRFCPSATGGRQPITRYLSKRLLNRITFAEKEALSQVVPAVLNGLPHDVDYNPEPDRSGETLQSWEALRSLEEQIVAGDLSTGVSNCRTAIDQARQAYAAVAAAGIALDMKSREDHLDPLWQAIEQFEERAEL